VVAQEVKYTAVQVIGPGFRDSRHGTAGMHTAGLSGKSAGFHLELLQRIRKRERQIAAVVRIVVSGAIQNISYGSIESTRDGHVSTPFDNPAVGRRHRGIDGPAGKTDQVRNLPSVKR